MLARRGVLSTALVWVGPVVVVAVASTTASSVSGLCVVVLTVELVLLALLMTISFVGLRERAAAQ